MRKPAATRAIILSALLLGAWAGGASAQEKPQTVRLATDIPYEPMEYAKPDGSFTGFDIDLGNALCQQAKLHCTWSDQNWDGIIPGLEARKYDAIMSSMTITEERAKHVLFTDPYVVLPSAWFVPEDSPIQTISDATLKDKTVGVQRGTIQDNYTSDIYGKIARIKRYQQADDMAVDMDVNRLDAVFVTQTTGVNKLMEANPGKYRQVGKSINKPVKYFGVGMGIALRKSDQALAEKFNQALLEVKANGTYATIYKRYFHEDPPTD